MIETQKKYIRKEPESPRHESREIRLQRETSVGIRDTYDRIPEGHSYHPAYSYPSERVPENELVPDLPDPISRVDDVPLEDKDYDEELDEFVFKPESGGISAVLGYRNVLDIFDNITNPVSQWC